MAIQFARCEYVSRSSGGNACRKASYNQRETIACERTGQVFSFKERGGNIHHEVLLPEGVHEKFRNSEILWNEAERCEKRKDSQVQKEFVLALPDDKEITFEDRIELARRFSRANFVEKGLGAQLDIHEPHDGESNWHAHLLVTTRRFSEDGLSFSAKKARDLDPIIKSRLVVEGDLWGEIWRDTQNSYFEEKGYEVRVDPIGILSQEHLGPVRMRHHLNEAVLRSQMLQKANESLAQDPKSVIETMTRNRAVFTQKDIEVFLKKYVPLNERTELVERIMGHPYVVPLYDKETGEKTECFTTEEVRAEEEKLCRFAEGIAEKIRTSLPVRIAEESLGQKELSLEQKKAYEHCVRSGANLCMIQGRAGVGKSYVLDSIRAAHEGSSYRVLGLAPTHKVATDLKTSGFKEAKTCHAFLFAYKNRRETLNSNTLVVVDEAGMLGTELSVELLHVIKSSGAKLVLVGDDRQLSSVERGGGFGFLAERYNAVELKEVRRQTIPWQKQVSEELSQGAIRSAVHLLEENKAIHWKDTKEEALSDLLKAWAKESLLYPHETHQILAQRNIDVDALNQGAREILRKQGRLGDVELICMTQRGRANFAEGDRLQFTKTDKELGLKAGYFGTLERIHPATKKITICLDSKEKIEVDPHVYDGLRHGYAATIYKAQGSTLDRLYILHSKATNTLVNYVALTRQTKSLSLYVSQEETPNEACLIRQMSREEGKGMSLGFDTQKDIFRKQEEKSFSTHLIQGAEALVTKVKDIFHKNEDFYNVEKPLPKSKEGVTLATLIPQRDEPIDNLVSPLHGEGEKVIKEPGDNRSLEGVNSFIDAKRVEEALKQNMASFADDIFSSLGEPLHKGSSSATQRRYGKNGHISVNLRTGAWINFKDSELSGGPFHMLTKLKGMEFKEAVEYGAAWAGVIDTSIGPDKPLVLAPRHEDLPSTEKERSEQEEAEKRGRVEKAQALWAKGELIKGTLAERYLREHRKIARASFYDLRMLPDYKDPASGKSFSCLMAAARSATREITAVQLTFLNPETGAKADVPVQKKSFGVLKGSFVTLQEGTKDKPIFVTEGVETALSIKEAGVPGTVMASLGLSNLKHLASSSWSLDAPGGGNGDISSEKAPQRIIVCADHDDPESVAAKSLEKSVLFLQEKGHLVTVIKPETLHEDFNDVLKAHGDDAVKSYVRAAFNQAPLTPGSVTKLTQEKRSMTPVAGEKTDNLETAHEEMLLQGSLQKEHSHQAAPLDAKVAKDLISPALQAVYEDWKHPGFKDDTFYKKVFKEGMELYGEERAIAYWHSKRGGLLTFYEKKGEAVEKELHSPLLAHLSEETKALARKMALEDPDRTLKILSQYIYKTEEPEKITQAPLKEKDTSPFGDEKNDLSRGSKEASEDRLNLSQRRQVNKNKLGETYSRFKELGRTIENTLHPPSSLRKEFKELGYELSQDKDFMNALRHEDIKAAKTIERMRAAHEQSLSLGRDRGGYSL